MIIGFDGSRISVAERTGTEQYSYLLLKHLLEMDDDSLIKLYERQPIVDEALQSERIEHVLINRQRLWTQWGLAKELWRAKPDVLFIPAHTLPVLRPLGTKSVVTIHDLGYEYLPQYHQFPHKLYLNKSTEYAAAHATKLIAVSEFTKQDLMTKLRVPAERIEVVYEGVETAVYKQITSAAVKRVASKYGLERPYVLFVGTVQPRKNLVRLIEAFAGVDKGFDLVIAGGKGWLSDDIYAAPQRLGLTDRVKFLGYIDEADKPGLYGGATVTALVSLFEGFGLPMIESMASGTPVVSARGSSLTEVVGQAGMLVDPLSVESIAEGLRKTISDSSLRAQYVVAGYEQIKLFDWKVAAEQTLDILKKVARS